MKTAAILVAAGSSARMKSGGASKTMMELGGEPVLSRTLRAFENAACISKIVIVARACDFDAIQKASAFVTKPLTITEGGKERQDSVSNGAALCDDAEYIAVHDAARPFITPEEIETVCADAEKYGAATLAVPVKDTIKAELSRQGVDELTAGEYKVRWMAVKSSRLDTSALRKAAPELCEKFTRSVETKRFCVA